MAYRSKVAGLMGFLLFGFLVMTYTSISWTYSDRATTWKAHTMREDRRHFHRHPDVEKQLTIISSQLSRIVEQIENAKARLKPDVDLPEVGQLPAGAPELATKTKQSGGSASSSAAPASVMESLPASASARLTSSSSSASESSAAGPSGEAASAAVSSSSPSPSSASASESSGTAVTVSSSSSASSSPRQEKDEHKYPELFGQTNLEPDWQAFRRTRQFYALRRLRALRKEQFGSLSDASAFTAKTEGLQLPLVDKMGKAVPITSEQKKKIADTWKHVDNSKEIVVMVKTGHMFGSDYVSRKRCELPDGRPLKCLFTSDPLLESRADALWFHAPGMGQPPSARSGRDNPRQRVVVMSMESEINYPSMTAAQRQFDREYEKLEDKSLHSITMNYRMDSDVPTVYAFYNNESKPLPISEKLPRAVYMQSNCVGTRDNYVRELMKHFPVDARGRCLNNKPTTVGRNMYFKNIDVYKAYKFSLCMENTVGDFYTTERLFHALEAGSVPIYFGAPTIDLYVPRGSVIFAADYPDPKDLAEHLNMLNKDHDAYNEYLAYRKDDIGLGLRALLSLGSGDNAPFNPECRLCIKLAHKCDRTCTCGGRRYDRQSFYDGKPWKLLEKEKAHKH